MTRSGTNPSGVATTGRPSHSASATTSGPDSHDRRAPRRRRPRPAGRPAIGARADEPDDRPGQAGGVHRRLPERVPVRTLAGDDDHQRRGRDRRARRRPRSGPASPSEGAGDRTPTTSGTVAVDAEHGPHLRRCVRRAPAAARPGGRPGSRPGGTRPASAAASPGDVAITSSTRAGQPRLEPAQRAGSARPPWPGQHGVVHGQHQRRPARHERWRPTPPSDRGRGPGRGLRRRGAAPHQARDEVGGARPVGDRATSTSTGPAAEHARPARPRPPPSLARAGRRGGAATWARMPPVDGPSTCTTRSPIDATVTRPVSHGRAARATGAGGPRAGTPAR